MKGRYFTDANGNYYEAIIPIETPEGHTAVAKRAPQPLSLEGRRQTKVIDVDVFLVNAVANGAITEADADIAITGQWPTVFNTFVESLPFAERMKAKLDWRTTTTVRRIAPVFDSMVADPNTQVTDDLLDRIFGLV